MNYSEMLTLLGADQSRKDEVLHIVLLIQSASIAQVYLRADRPCRLSSALSADDRCQMSARNPATRKHNHIP